MRLFDSNIIIYSSQPAYAWLRPLLEAPDAFLSAVSKVEVLGYPDLTERDRSYCENLFATAEIIPITDEVLEQAIALRRLRRRMGLGDALIAATALTYDLTLVTNNEADFRGLDEQLRLENPIPHGG